LTDSASSDKNSLHDFMRLCLLAAWQPEGLSAARQLALQDPPDWCALWQEAESLRLTPLLYLATQGQSLVPADVEQSLRLCYADNALRNALWLHELEEGLAALASADVPVILLKGAALAVTVYANPAARVMTDLDVLVQRRNVEAALAALARLGWRAGLQVRPGNLPVYDNEAALFRPGPASAPLELHCSLLDSPFYQARIPMAWFWQTAKPVRVNGHPAYVLGPEAEVLYLAAHQILHHRGAGLLWLYDLAQIIVRCQAAFDWNELISRAVAYNLVLPLQLTLPQLAADWGVSVPAAALNRLTGLHPTRCEASNFRALTTPNRSAGRRFVDDLVAQPDWRLRLKYAWHNAAPQPAYMRQHYGVRHGWALPFYYPYRWATGLRGLAHACPTQSRLPPAVPTSGRDPQSPARSTEMWLPLLQEMLAREGHFRWPLRGSSMQPTLPAACNIEIVPLRNPVRLGDIIVFSRQNALIAHRLVARKRSAWTTQGDGCLTPDAPLDPGLALGAVTAAYVANQRCWPGRLARPLGPYWVLRYYMLRPVRALWRAGRRKPGCEDATVLDKA
jgi:hypothetical protein